MSVTDFNAMKKWNIIPKSIQGRLLSNVFCVKCGVTTIVDYSIQNHKLGILLSGKCKKCGHSVARLIEDEE
ncbi:hypothetical protein HYG86_01380 [Alkalicella caledoniensis]|uniref:Uncharacterized protein n=1 Tax=Alkalicella caledoniensis TaxID=2731377 RepID=A0A7G9W4A0_ALKCA|nr:hypothetical protein [Alkalicella caledoniensis]QNO13512.1 hypothetical protein HYG86_01380 [Alkalicella caledoniensis]